MKRKNYLATIGTTASLVSFSGCLVSTSEVDGDLVVDDTVIGNTQFTFEANEEDMINIWGHNTEGRLAIISIEGPELKVGSLQIETEKSSSFNAISTGTHVAIIAQSGFGGEVEVQIGVENQPD
ncbi:hypothetical protein KM295_00315 [Natronomonas sp. F2-12]|uniref:Uncharacterized protein n=1 Tax=Natronomonas aquatica TaxID=2841590 RepID=A0A9R1D347_9EURY|nr:hypothetical protein [Natronomonas aquatica]MCQ4331949.1 hypothetical protein [Natronomonas aquatica]